MEKIVALEEALQQKILYYERGVTENKMFAVKLGEQDKELVGKTKDILAREAKINPLENVNALREIAAQEKREADALMKSLRKERDEFNKFVASEKTDIARLRQQGLIDIAKAHNEIEKAQKEWVNLKKEQETWKAKFFEEVKNKVR